MSQNLPQYYENSLDPLPITKETLLHTIQEFVDYVQRAVRLINSNVKSPKTKDITEYGTIFSGYIGDYAF